MDIKQDEGSKLWILNQDDHKEDNKYSWDKPCVTTTSDTKTKFEF